MRRLMFPIRLGLLTLLAATAFAVPAADPEDKPTKGHEAIGCTWCLPEAQDAWRRTQSSDSFTRGRLRYREALCPSRGSYRYASISASNTVPCGDAGQQVKARTRQERSFKNSFDGTVTDTTTGLMWEAKCDGKPCLSIHDKDTIYEFSKAVARHLAKLNGTCDGDHTTRCTNDSPDCDDIGNGLCGHAGYNDWRMPTVSELQTLSNRYDRYVTVPTTFRAFNYSCRADCDVNTCSCTAPNYYWSTSKSVGFGYGDLYGNNRELFQHMRAVRGGP